jgi:hypothetical protein
MCTIVLLYSNQRLIKHDKANVLKMSGHGYIIVMTFLVRECYGSPKKQEF